MQEFEPAYAKLLGAKRCLATASGTTALITALHVMGVDAGDEVIVSPYTFIATYNAVLSHKALPVFADTDPETLTVDPASIESRITDRTRAIVPVHIFGMPCDMDPINAIAKKHKLGVVEDACQAWLAEYKGRKCGTLGRSGLLQLSKLQASPLRRRRRHHRQQRRAARPLPRLSQLRSGDGQLSGPGLFHARQQLPHAALSGGHPLATDRQAGQRDRGAASKCRLSGGAAQGNPRRHAGAPAGKQPRGVASLPAALRSPAVQRAFARPGSWKRCVPRGSRAAPSITSSISTACLDEAINSRGYQRLFGAERLKAYRESFQELKGNRQVCSTTVAFTQNLLLAKRESARPDRRSDPQDSGPQRRAGENGVMRRTARSYGAVSITKLCFAVPTSSIPVSRIFSTPHCNMSGVKAPPLAPQRDFHGHIETSSFVRRAG